MQIKKTNRLSRFTFCLLIVILAFLLFPAGASPISAQPVETAYIYYFWGEGCPACAQAGPALKAIAEQNPNVQLLSFEIYHDQANVELFFTFGEAYGMEPRGVPTMFVADQHWVGYSPNITAQIEQTLAVCLSEGCTDLGRALVNLDDISVNDTDQETLPARSLLTTVLIISAAAFGVVVLLMIVMRVILPRFNR